MRPAFPFVLCAAFAAIPCITGCGEKTVSKTTETEHASNGDMKTTEKKVTQDSDGVVKEKTTVKEENH